MGLHKFSSIFAFLIFILVGLIYLTCMLIHIHPFLSTLLLFQSLSTLSCFSLLGIGLGLPMILVAGVLGWGQLVLLMTGNVDPHLSKAGLFKVLNTLFSRAF